MANLKLREPDRNCLLAIHALITKDPFFHHTIDSLAYEAGINKTKLSSGFKQMFGMGVYEFQVHLRMERAESLLLESDKTVQMIALLTGYKTKNSFTIAFKKKHTMPPNQWRKKNSMVAM